MMKYVMEWVEGCCIIVGKVVCYIEIFNVCYLMKLIKDLFFFLFFYKLRIIWNFVNMLNFFDKYKIISCINEIVYVNVKVYFDCIYIVFYLYIFLEWSVLWY